jgi:putative addiction module component (TIGR02574 family)
MTATSEQILTQALALDERERVELAERLWESVESAPHEDDLTDEQKAMLDRRWEEIESGKVKCRPFDDVLVELTEKLHSSRGA